MDKRVSHHRSDETLEAKARWVQSLSLEERIDLLNSFTDMILEANPKIMEQKRAQPVEDVFASLQKHQVTKQTRYKGPAFNQP